MMSSEIGVGRICWYVVFEVLYLLHNTKIKIYNTSRVDFWDDIHSRYLSQMVKSLARRQRHGSATCNCQ